MSVNNNAAKTLPVTDYRIYVASLSDYNAGYLHGLWIDCDCKTAEELESEVQAMLKTSPATKKYGDIAEEYAIHDHEGFGDLIGEYTPLFEVAEIVESLESADNPEALMVFADNFGYDIREASERFEDAYYGEWDSETDFAWDYAENTGDLASVPEHMQSYIDMEAYANSLFSGDYTFCDGYVFNGNF